MSDKFIPFGPRIASAGESPASGFQLKTVPTSPQTSPSSITACLPDSTGSTLPGGPIKHAAPQITLQRDGDRVTIIQVQCSCGQVIELKCV